MSTTLAVVFLEVPGEWKDEIFPLALLSMTKAIPLFNITVAQRLKEVAELLHSQGSNPFRVLAYQHAAQTLEQLKRPIDDLVRAEGLEGLQKLPGIGESLARAIRELVLRGRLPMLERLNGAGKPLGHYSRNREKTAPPPPS